MMLKGLRILGTTRVTARPFCTALPADPGAEVIKLEPPQRDDCRHIGPFVQGESALFTVMNRGKQSIILDLKDLKNLPGANLPEPFGSGILIEVLYAAVEVVAGACGSTRLGPEGTGFKTAMKVLNSSWLEVAGIAEAALALAKDWCKTRIIGGDPLASRQGIHWQLADMATDLAAARALAAQAVALRETGTGFAAHSSMAKLFASEMAHRVTDAGLQPYGGYGFTRDFLPDFPLERFARDVRIFRVYEGSSKILRTIIAGHNL